MRTHDGGPAFPFTCQGPTTGPETYYGMSLRDYFAARALAGSLADPEVVAADKRRLARFCYQMADAMLAEREQDAPDATKE